MSSYSIIYIEYKDNRDDDWHLLNAFVPLEDKEWKREKPEEEQENIITLEGKKFSISNYIERCGVIRDFLNDPGRKFNNRGFPTDLSIGVKEILDRQQEKIDEMNNADTSENRFNHDWRYGKSWCYLTELEESVSSSYNHSEKLFIMSKFSDELMKIYNKIDDLGKKVLPNPPDTMETCESGDALFDESDMDDLIYAKSFCYYISDLVGFITGTYILENNIRLIYYTE